MNEMKQENAVTDPACAWGGRTDTEFTTHGAMHVNGVAGCQCEPQSLLWDFLLL